MKPDIEELRKKYIENPPEGMTSRDIRHMSEEELLDMDYFLMMTNLMTILERKAFISSNPRIVLSSCPPPCGHFSIQESATGGLSYKVKKPLLTQRLNDIIILLYKTNLYRAPQQKFFILAGILAPVSS